MSPDINTLGIPPERAPDAPAPIHNPRMERLEFAAGMPESPQAARLQHLLAAETVGEWAAGARKRIIGGGCLEKVRNTAESLPEGWKKLLVRLEAVATPSDDAAAQTMRSKPDPVEILWQAGIAESQAEAKLKQTFPPSAEADKAANAIKSVCQSFRNAIGIPHGAVVTANPFAHLDNPDVRGRGVELLRTLGFVVGAAGAIAAGIIASLTKNNPNWTPALVYALFAASMAVDLTFLTEPTGHWERLQHVYGLTGDDWRAFAQALYDNHDNDAVEKIRGGRKKLTAEEQAAIVNFAPEGIRRAVRGMLQSSQGDVTHSDLRLFLGLLNRASAREDQNRVLVYIQTGATRRSLGALARRDRITPPSA